MLSYPLDMFRNENVMLSLLFVYYAGLGDLRNRAVKIVPEQVCGYLEDAVEPPARDSADE